MENIAVLLRVVTAGTDALLNILFLHVLVGRERADHPRAALWAISGALLCIGMDYLGQPFLLKSALFIAWSTVYGKRVLRLHWSVSAALSALFMALIYVCELSVMWFAKHFFDGRLLIELEQTLPYQVFCMAVSRASLFAIVGLLLLLWRRDGSVNIPRFSRPYWILLFATIGTFGSVVGLLIFSLALRPQMLEQVLHWLTGIFVLILLTFFVLLFRIAKETERQYTLEAELRQAELQLRQQDTLQTMHEQLRGLRHDYHNHMQIVSLLAEQGRLDELRTYIGELAESVGPASVATGNPYVDAVINAKLMVAAAHGVAMQTDIYFPNALLISPADLCCVLFNLLDNALEACERNTDAAHKRIRLTLRQQKGFLCVSCDNPVEQPPTQGRDGFKSHKSSGLHGIGLRQMCRIAQKYEGLFEAEFIDGAFRAHMLLPNAAEATRFYACCVNVSSAHTEENIV